ncbi:translocation/assembly module TamB domain-containing protein [Acinetobacter sp. MD2(2019)]|uniref:translocation/assembly module TamB domain-containing protein n=1 Tax=Acinetobacter sp. MD2(2019) TaxID=2605273 RepID=UPI002D1F6588|nr:translocation/assembly module TamB domain-containing protein [Acinetobacter sp. MD2(2019)]MEB3754769.1 translocation/assembly module TamB domain-containing protein [Acinetobacter sp. MD2(2019)]
MAEQQQQAPQSTDNTHVPKCAVMKKIIYALAVLLVLLIGAIAVMFSTDKGSQFLLDRVLKNQKMIEYKYEGGNFLRGLILSQIDVHLDGLQIKAQRADVMIGWRAIVQKEVHFSRANIQKLEIIDNKPPSNEAFKFSPINLPVTLRFDRATLDQLIIKTTSAQVDFKDIHLNKALWAGTKLQFENSSFDMGYLNVKQATGQMKFEGKYPLQVTAKANLPSLHSINVHDISVHAIGTLDTITAGVATHTPDMLTGRIIIHPVRQNVPMYGQLNFKNYHLPLLTDYKLFAPLGVAKLNGTASGMNIQLDTKLSGQNIPEGNYHASMYTDYVHQLNLTQLTGQVLQGALNATGVVNWEKAVYWDVHGNMKGMQPNDKTLPQTVKDFLPKILDAQLASTGNLDKGLHVTGLLKFDQAETWNLKLDQAEQTTNKVPPMLLNVGWEKIDRAMPYIGWLNSQNGQANITLNTDRQDIVVDTQIQKNEQGLLPTGQYQAKLFVDKNDLHIPAFKYITDKGGLTGQAFVALPTDKRELKWNAQLEAKNFNPQTVSTSSPIDLVNGRVNANGYAQKNQQIITLKGLDLLGRIPQQNNEMVHLTGDSTIAVILNDEKAGGGLKGYAVHYLGALQSERIKNSAGLLQFNLSGTSDFIKISKFIHDGVAGKILADGSVSLKNGISWKANASLVRFKPQYFVSNATGEISGVLQTNGVWSDHLKRVAVQQLNLAGVLNRQVIRGKGNLSVLLNSSKNGLVPQHFEANDLFLAYAGNQLQATGDAQKLHLQINAPALYAVYSGLRGRAYGYLDLETKPRLKANANLAIDNFGFKDTLSIQKVRIRGELPTSDTASTVLKSEINNMRWGKREIQYAAATMSGTRKAHILQLQAWNNYSKFYTQLAGGFNANNDWTGQIQQGVFDSVRAVLKQQQNANVIYRAANKQLYVSAHCWLSNESQLCFDQPIQINPSAGNVSFVAKNLDLNDFSAFMPDGLAMTGQMNGYAKAAWANGKRPQIDAKLITQNGQIGMTADDPDDPSTTTSYQQLSLIAKSVTQGLQLRLDAKTADIGTGYANVVVNPYDDRLPMQGEFAFDQVDLSFLKPFIQDVRSIGGTLSVAGKINGTLTQPLMTGDLRLKNGHLSMISLPVNINNLQVYSAIRQNQASITGAFNSGRGVAKLDGLFDWSGEPRLQLNLKGNDLLIRQAPLITAVINSDMALNVYPLKRSVSLKGSIDVPRALINMPESTKSVVNVSSDVRVLHAGEDPLTLLRQARPWDIQADIDLSLGKQVIFQGFNSRIPLAGRMLLTQRGLETAMSANGAIGVSQKVKIEAYGQTLDLNRAIARFNGPLANPTLDIDATKSISSTLVGVRVTGTASVPSIQVYNDGGLSEQEALNALVTGRINEGSSSLSQTESFKSDVNNTVAAAGISLGLGGTRAFTNQIGRTFGLSGLALDAQGTGDDTQVSVTGYITPDLYLRYGVGVFTNVNKLTLRYQMNKRLYLEASQSVERAIDLFYNWRF